MPNLLSLKGPRQRTYFGNKIEYCKMFRDNLIETKPKLGVKPLVDLKSVYESLELGDLEHRFEMIIYLIRTVWNYESPKLFDDICVFLILFLIVRTHSRFIA